MLTCSVNMEHMKNANDTNNRLLVSWKKILLFYFARLLIDFGDFLMNKKINKLLKMVYLIGFIHIKLLALFFFSRLGPV